MKLYLIQWSYYTSLDGGTELDSIWTDKEKAKKYLQDKATKRYLKKSRSKKGIEYPDTYTDGDYWIGMIEVNSDTQWMHGDPNET